ncbi:MAG: peptidoglycan DD-metalloendopeptidase family protein [Patescibacteria group bacterium]|jgi:murein DD-endopeptidase MepM/ murein hydrolase activator NlpD
MPNNLTKKIILTAGLAILAVFGILQVVQAATEQGSTDDQAATAELNKQIEAQKAKIDQLTQQITEYQTNVKNNRLEQVSLQNQLNILSNQIGKTDLDIQIKEEEAKEVQLEIERTNINIKKNEGLMENEKDKLGNVLRLIARYDDKDYISILLGNNSFSEFFDQIKYSEDIRSDLQKTLNRLQELSDKLIDQKKELDKNKQRLADILNKLEDEKSILNNKKQEKNYLVTETKKSEKKFQTLITDLKKEQAAANAQVATLEKKLRDQLAKKGEKERFNQLGAAALNWPTASQRLTCVFHDPEYPYRYLFEHSGIDIGIKTGTPVKAADTGYVATIGRNTKWYGNYIMIIHGNNISTLYAHLSSINVDSDEYVTKGQLIGLSGSTGFSSGPHLHFEVRANGIPVDPLNYLP